MPTLLTVFAATAFQAEPTIPLPPPTGPNRVGIATFEWVDSARIDSLVSSPAARRVLVRVWYPGQHVGGVPTAPYVPPVSDVTNDWLALHARVRTNSQTRAAAIASPQRFPVIVFAPGRTTGTFDYTTLGEDLASHGYVVVGIDSPHHSKILQPDGTLAPIRFPSMGPSTYPDGIDAAQEPMNALVSADLRFAMRQLSVIDRDDPTLRGRLDLDRVAMAGHSNGAMAGSRACALEARCRAFLGIEGQQTRELRKSGVMKPYGQVYSEQTLAFDTLGVFTEMRLTAKAPFVLYRVNGAGHNSFTDLLLVRPTLFNYPMAAMRGVEVTRSIVRSFFDWALLVKVGGNSLASGPAEVRAERYGPDLPRGQAP